MDIFLICCWYISGVFSLILLLRFSNQSLSGHLPLIAVGALIGPTGLIIGLLIKSIPGRRAELIYSHERKDIFEVSK